MYPHFPVNLHTIALMAVVNKSLRLKVRVILGIHNYIFVAVSQCRPTFGSIAEIVGV